MNERARLNVRLARMSQMIVSCRSCFIRIQFKKVEIGFKLSANNRVISGKNLGLDRVRNMLLRYEYIE